MSYEQTIVLVRIYQQWLHNALGIISRKEKKKLFINVIEIYNKNRIREFKQKLRNQRKWRSPVRMASTETKNMSGRERSESKSKI